MATTREKAEAYAYENRRQVTSLIRGADEALGDPRQRLTRSMTGGIAVGVLISAVFGVIGLLGGGKGPELPDRGAVVVAGSGSTYVVLDGVVHEALNLSSALLAGGGPPVTEVRAEALVGTPRGLPIGIPEAPNALPGKESLTREPWTICTVPFDSTGGTPQVSLYVGLPAPDGELGNADKVLLRSPDGQVWLVTKGHRYALPGQTQALLGLRRVDPIPLSVEIIATIPEGPTKTVSDMITRGERPEVRQLERDQALCVSTRLEDNPGDAPWQVRLHMPGALPTHAGISPVTSGNGRLLEAVLIRSGSGALVRSATSAGKDGAYTLITDSGQRYLIVSAEAVSRLGYDRNAVPNLPSPFVDLLPPGPDLDPVAAGKRPSTR